MQSMLPRVTFNNTIVSPAGRRGVAATEIALTAPVMILLCLAAADFGRVAHWDQAISNAARTGAETGATQKVTDFTRPTWEAEIRRAVVDELSNLPGFREEDLDYTLTANTSADGLTQIVVAVQYPFRTIVSWPGLPNEIQLQERFETRQFR